jgi:ZIP family zinc transporter
MSLWAAFLWGGLLSALLYIGEALARPMERAHRLTGLVMGFGAGTLLSAVAYELIPEANLALDVGKRLRDVPVPDPHDVHPANMAL